MAVDVSEIRRLVREPQKIPSDFDSYYDREADVLYVTFAKGVEDYSDFTQEDVVLRYREGDLLSITVLHASTREGLHLTA